MNYRNVSITYLKNNLAAIEQEIELINTAPGNVIPFLVATSITEHLNALKEIIEKELFYRSQGR